MPPEPSEPTVGAAASMAEAARPGADLLAELLAADELAQLPVPELARLLAQVESVSNAWRAVARTLNEYVGQTLHNRDLMDAVIGGVYVAAEWEPPRRRWDREAVTAAVRRAALDARKLNRQGEVEAPEEALDRAYRQCFRFEPRSQPIERLGLDPDEFSEATGAGRWKARVRVEEEQEVTP